MMKRIVNPQSVNTRFEVYFKDEDGNNHVTGAYENVFNAKVFAMDLRAKHPDYTDIIIMKIRTTMVERI